MTFVPQDRRTGVLHIITRLDVGGSTDNTILTVLGLDKEKFRIALAHGSTSLPSKMVKELRGSSEVEILEIPSLVRNIQPWSDMKALFRLYRIIKKGKYRIVHTHCSKGGLLGRLAAVLARTPVRIHTPHGHIFYGHFGRIASWIFLWLERILARWTHMIITLTGQGKKEHLSYGVGTPGSLEVIHSGVKLEPFLQANDEQHSVKQELHLPHHARVVGMVGWLTPIKGPNYLVEAWHIVERDLSDAALLIVGDGPLRGELEELVRRNGSNGSVVFTGMRQDVPRLMGTMDVVVLPSVNEGMGKVLVEAMALGKPLVATHVGGIPDLVKDGVNGYLVPPRDPAALAGAITDLLSNPEKARQYGEAGKEIAPRFSAERMVEKIEQLYLREINDLERKL